VKVFFSIISTFAINLFGLIFFRVKSDSRSFDYIVVFLPIEVLNHSIWKTSVTIMKSLF
jgi:hypothetical protein